MHTHTTYPPPLATKLTNPLDIRTRRVYGNRGVSPSTRMGSAWRMRERFAAAKALKDAQDAFCAGTSTADAFPEDLALDSLVALLRGDAQLHMHCYRVQDLETAIRMWVHLCCCFC